MVCPLGSGRMEALTRFPVAGNIQRTASEEAGRHKLAAQYIQRELREADEANLIGEEDMHVFGLRPLTDPLHLVCCNACKKPIKASQYVAHSELCKSLNSAEEIALEVNDGTVHKKRPRKERKKSLTAFSNKPVSVRKKAKPELLDNGFAASSCCSEELHSTVSFPKDKRISSHLNVATVRNSSMVNPGPVDCSEGAILHQEENSKMLIAGNRQLLANFGAVNGVTKSWSANSREAIPDDTLVFCEAEQEQICYLRVILVVFEACSGLKVNWRKSSIFPIKEVQQIEDLASILKCKIEKLPTVYLGMPLGSEHKAGKIWDGIIEKTEKKLAIWKSQYLSLGGRVTLINSILDSLPTYVMSLFPIPSSIVKVLDALRRNFLWQGNKIEKGFNLVKWPVVQQSKENGGLGVRNLKVHNMSLLSKWLWRYNQEEQALWKEIINHKYGQEDFWCTSEVNETYGVGVWRTIRNLWESLKNNSKIVVGRGDKTKFWLDDWCGNGILRDLFPILFSICTNTNSKIEEMWSPQGWNIIIRRLLNDWEIDGMAECLGLIGGFPGTTLEPDRLAWGHHKDGVFSVNRLYNWGLKRCAGRSIGPWNTIWKSVAPAKVKCFTWLVARKKCLTHEAMQKRGINIVSRCLLCKEALETNKHLFMHCKVTAQVWALFTSIANEYWTMPEHTSDLLSCWIKRGGSKSQKRWWRTVPTCIWWIIWKERNQRIFEGKECTIQKIKWKVITTLGFWCKEQDIEEEFQLVDFIGSL